MHVVSATKRRNKPPGANGVQMFRVMNWLVGEPFGGTHAIHFQ